LLTEKATKLEYRLLTQFRRLLEGKIYKHRDSSQGDFVAMHLYEDLIAINRSAKLVDAVINRKDRVLNVQNKRRGVAARRGDGAFGEIIPGETPITDPGYLVARGAIATVGIGIEVTYQEAPEAEQRLMALAAPHFDEFLICRFKATNAPPIRSSGSTTTKRAWIMQRRSHGPVPGINSGSDSIRASISRERSHTSG
jgi:hypothetical protein